MERADLNELLRQTGCAEEAGGFTFLCDPRWGIAERAQVAVLQHTAATGGLDSKLGWLCVPTGGTTGGVRFARHDERTLSAAVDGFCRFFGLGAVNTVDVLPPYHVSGLMARVRCHATGGRYFPWAWKELVAGSLPTLDAVSGGWVISLVPTQLQRLLATRQATEWLRGFKLVFVGGGPTWPELEQAAMLAGLPLALTYGMTETAAMVAAIRPADFFAGERLHATAMPHARLTISSTGAVRVAGGSVFRGYFPEFRSAREFETDDIGDIAADGTVRILGRRDAAIITGGKKVQPEEVETALRATGQFDDIAVIGVPDAEWGEIVVAAYPASKRSLDLTCVEQVLASLTPYKRPKKYVAVPEWPRTAQGKLSRARLVEHVRSLARTDTASA